MISTMKVMTIPKPSTVNNVSLVAIRYSAPVIVAARRRRAFIRSSGCDGVSCQQAIIAAQQRQFSLARPKRTGDDRSAGIPKIATVETAVFLGCGHYVAANGQGLSKFSNKFLLLRCNDG
ncbi:MULTISPECIES: hypothetical protein [Sphingomonadaceae]|jgi:hypothetical protein|uniref:hypothetical protein n=1 Tax=Sphingomonadales TaxID=204457 RepID=UPI001594E60B|nr:hypothetical protein [Sphingobium sp. GW456-12-10-14-TSB1]